MTLIRGECVAPGVAVGQIYLRGFASHDSGPRIAADEVESELNRLKQALESSRCQMEEIKQKQADTLGEAELRIFDAHLAYLGDAMFVTEIENQVINERLSAREAVQGVFAKYDRIFSLVESDLLRRRASDLRDVATRLLRKAARATSKSLHAYSPLHTNFTAYGVTATARRAKSLLARRSSPAYWRTSWGGGGLSSNFPA